MTMPSNPEELPPPPTLAAYDAKRGLKRWRTTWRVGAGSAGRRSRTFGYFPETDKATALKRYHRWLEQWKAKGHVRDDRGEEAAFTVARLAGRYLRHADRTYRKNGRRTSHVENVRYAMRSLRDAYGERPADALGAPELAKLRDEGLLWKRINGQTPRAMKTVNQRLRIVKDAFVWARERGLVSAATLADVSSVKRLRKGRSAAKDPRKVMSVAPAVVAESMKFAPPVIRDMVELQELTGMRPGEVCSMRGRDVETGQDVWLYRPGHKLEHMEGAAGGEKIVCLGPKAKAIVSRYLKPDLSAHLFSPREAHGQRLAERRDGRKLKLWTSHARRLKADPTGRLAERYTEATYRRAVWYACGAAQKHLRKSEPGAVFPYWSPNQLRHSAATRLQKAYGLEGSRVVLGHRHGSTTEIYLDPDVQRAMQIAREVG